MPIRHGGPGFREFALDREHFLGTVEDLVDHLLRIHLWCGGLGDRAHRRAAVTLDGVPDDAEGDLTCGGVVDVRNDPRARSA